MSTIEKAKLMDVKSQPCSFRTLVSLEMVSFFQALPIYLSGLTSENTSSHLICQLNMPSISLLSFYGVKPDIMGIVESQNTGVSEAGFGKLTLNYLASLS